MNDKSRDLLVAQVFENKQNHVVVDKTIQKVALESPED